MASAHERTASAWSGISSAVRRATGLLLAILCFAASAQPGELVVGAQTQYDISRDLLHFEDTSASMTLDQVSAPAFAPNFKPFDQKGTSYNFGFTTSAHWLRITLRAGVDAPSLWYWKVTPPLLDTLDLYVSRPGGGYAHERAGDALPMSCVPLRTRIW